MRFARVALAAIILAGLLPVGPSRAQDRAGTMLRANDADGDGRLSRAEWPRKPRGFDRADTDKDGYLTLDELRARFGEGGDDAGRGQRPAGSAAATPDGAVPRSALDAETLCGIGRGRDCEAAAQIRLGLFETGLEPRFPAGLDCRGIDEGYAINYSHKRSREAYHGGIDMPAPFGTPIVAAADGTVVFATVGKDSMRGIEVILRHTPAQTGLPVWVYTQYAHFDGPPAVAVGDAVTQGQVLGPTGNSGKTPGGRGGGGRERRPAIHYAVWYSSDPRYATVHDKIIPVRGRWMDPVALYRGAPPFDSDAMKALPDAEKKVPVAVMTEDGKRHPPGAKVIWPYTCKGG